MIRDKMNEMTTVAPIFSLPTFFLLFLVPSVSSVSYGYANTACKPHT